MSVVVMLALLWWGLCGFIAFVCGLIAVYSSFGPTGRGIIIILLTCLGIYMMEHHIGAEKRAADGFLTAWVAASAGYPEGESNTRGMWEFMDFNRIRNFDGYFPNQFRLLSRSSVRDAGKETILTDRDPKPVRTKVFLSNIKIHGGEHDVDFKAKLRVWVAQDSDEVVKFMFEDLSFL
jgi:hypothetical protein